MNDNDNFYSRVPLRLIYISLLLAMLFDFIPFSGSLFYWLPEFSALMLYYWLINRPQNVDVGTAFLIGLLVDIGTAAPLGQHALAYILSAHVIIRYRRQIVLYNYGAQAVMVAGALMVAEIVLVLVRLRFDNRFSGWFTFISPFIGAFLWPLINKIMVSILNFRQLRR
ncbi:MAG: rod shape-determining protein MreD [Alysiella sp.]|uniref:rod shape-determining protein MreD n=1 Tax=Alysiella sp. TaxID=1872483 RepID=UPI0026DAC7AD|nr:rod shape-determining protein MreD [Alysiella sp.]MDO4434541.1 rod shape-determining protein MreD [Alysiella sp.]